MWRFYCIYQQQLNGQHDPPSHLPPVPEWLVPLFSSSPTFDTPPDAVSGRLLHPTVLIPSGAGPAACGCLWVQFPLLIHWESEPRKRKSTCSPHYLCGMKDKARWEQPDNKKGHRRGENTQSWRVHVLDDRNIRKWVFLPEQFGWKRLIHHLLFAFGASTSLAAVHYLCTFHLVIPCSWQDVMSCALSVLYHSSYLETREDDRKGSITNMLWLWDYHIRC